MTKSKSTPTPKPDGENSTPIPLPAVIRTGPKRTREQKSLDLVTTAKMHLKGRTQKEIAEVIGVSHQQIKKDLQQIQKHWRDSELRDFDTLKSIEMRKIDNLEAEAWEAWERSCQDAEKLVVKTGGATVTSKGEVEPKPDEETLTVEPQAGDPRFLERVAWCIDRRCKLLGLDAPTKGILLTMDGTNEVPAHKVRDRIITICAAVDERRRIGGDGEAAPDGV